jgi:biopolymer transport protein ExbB/TolQ
MAQDLNLKKPKALALYAAFAALSIVVIFVISNLAPETWQVILVDPGSPLWPVTIQNIMWVVLSVGLADLILRWSSARKEHRALACDILPTDLQTVLTLDDLPKYYAQFNETPECAKTDTKRIIQRAIIQFQTSGSVGQTATLLNSSLDMVLHEIDLRYALTRYIAWLIPSLGFIGTVMGIGDALAFAGLPDAGANPDLLSELTSRLAVAFNTTFLALVMAAVLILLHTFVQGREEKAVNLVGQYCLDNLINKLVETEDMVVQDEA